MLLFHHWIGVVLSLNCLLLLSRLYSSPPLPIPTGKGSRSPTNEILSEYLEKSLNIPDLSLPEPIDLLLNDHVKNINIPEEIEYPLLELGDYQTIDCLLHSAREFGAFMIIDHGIFHEDSLQSLFIEDSYRVFRDLEQAGLTHPINFSDGKQNKEWISWIYSGNKPMKCTRDYFAANIYHNFRYMLITFDIVNYCHC